MLRQAGCWLPESGREKKSILALRFKSERPRSASSSVRYYKEDEWEKEKNLCDDVKGGRVATHGDRVRNAESVKREETHGKSHAIQRKRCRIAGLLLNCNGGGLIFIVEVGE